MDIAISRWDYIKKFLIDAGVEPEIIDIARSFYIDGFNDGYKFGKDDAYIVKQIKDDSTTYTYKVEDELG